LARAMPRTQAEELVKRACGVAVAENNSLIEVVKTLAGPSIKPGSVDWQTLADPANYLGESNRMIDRVLQQARKLS